MIVFYEKNDIKNKLKSLKNKKIVLVPTMGALHEGHISIIEKAKKEGDISIVSIFVNPLQFLEGEDFKIYPRDINSDIKKLKKLNIDYVFIPNIIDIYNDSFQNFIVNKNLDNDLCGKHRPGHFKGVLTIVLILINITKANVLVFDKKDYQQYIAIKKMIDDLHIDLDIKAFDTIRDENGLALSSRNSYLDIDSRKKASQIYKSLCKGHELFKNGNRNKKDIEEKVRSYLKNYDFNIEYISIRTADELKKINDIITANCVILISAYIKNIRLIDNIELVL